MQTQEEKYSPVQRAMGIVPLTCLKGVCISGEGNKVARVALELMNLKSML